MGERMTSAEANEMALTVGLNTPGGQTWSRAAAALWHWENEAIGREREAEARAGMPELRCPWRVVDREGEEWRQGYTKEVMLREDHLTKLAASYPKDAPFRLVRLAVVEVAEPEPVKPVREVGPSGWTYEARGGRVYQIDHEGAELVVDSPLMDMVPPADRALVARLLGEVG